MPIEVIFPRVDMDMTEGKIARWHVTDGETVTKGAPLFEIETDKAAMEIEAPASGIIRNITAAEGIPVPVGMAIAWIYGVGEVPVAQAAVPETIAAAVPVAAAPGNPLPVEDYAPAPVVVRKSGGNGKTAATPLARRLARERGVDVATISGTGPRGRIQSDDIRNAETRPVTPTPLPPVQKLDAGKNLPALHLIRKGDPALPPVLFIHGFGSELSIWKTTLAALDPSLPIAQIDLPAHGKSPLGSVESFEDIVDSVALALEQAKITACHIVGHSFGGVTAIALASSKRITVRSLMLIAPAGLGPDIEREFLQGFTRATRVESLMPWLRLLYAKPSLVSVAFAKAILDGRDDELLREQQRRILDTMFPDGTQAIDLSESLSSLPMPCKVLWGRQDRIIPITHSANLPGNVALHLLAETGHVPHLEQPALVARLISELVRTAG